MDEEFIKHNISPGGAADMLALTILVNAILKY
jgi:triphosphoribosyl-dephospho-CoA synthetase